MKSKRENPPAATGGSGIYCDRLAALHVPEIAQAPTEIQNRRTLWLARRYQLGPITAAAVAALAFGEATR
jgi:hypothetical protein